MIDFRKYLIFITYTKDLFKSIHLNKVVMISCRNFFINWLGTNCAVTYMTRSVER